MGIDVRSIGLLGRGGVIALVIFLYFMFVRVLSYLRRVRGKRTLRGRGYLSIRRYRGLLIY